MKITNDFDVNEWPTDNPPSSEQSAAETRRQRLRFAPFTPKPPTYLSKPSSPIERERRERELSEFYRTWPQPDGKFERARRKAELETWRVNGPIVQQPAKRKAKP